MEDAPSTLYPPLSFSAYSYRAVELIHRGLFKTSMNLTPEPDLAEKVEIIQSGNEGVSGDRNEKEKITLIIHLRKGEKTCYGKEITSGLVVSSIKKYMEQGRFPYIRYIGAEGKFKVRMVIERYASVFFDLTAPVFPENFTDCTGYFRVVEFIPKERTVLRSRDGRLEVVIKGVKNDITRVLEFEKGDVDIIVNAIPPHLIDYVRGISGVEIVETPGINISYIALNNKNPFLRHRKVRRAIFHAIDRKRVLDTVMGGMGELINSMLPRRSEFYCDCALYEFSPEKAEKLLDEAGFPKNKNGVRFSLIWKTSTVKYAIRNVKAIAGYLEKVGIKVRILPREFSTFFSDIRRGNFDIYSLSFVGVKDPELLRYILSSEMFPPRGANRVFFKNPRVDALLSSASREFDTERRKKLFREVQKILMEELPYIPLWQVKDVIAIRLKEGGIKKTDIKKMRFIPGGSLRFLVSLISQV